MFIYYRVGNKMQAIFDTYILSNIIVVETSRFVSSSFRLGGKKGASECLYRTVMNDTLLRKI